MTTHKNEFTVFPHVFTEALNQRENLSTSQDL